jgi:murein DD-endopeptidase MepM/ murein hydrolase activator NlpD
MIRFYIYTLILFLICSAVEAQVPTKVIRDSKRGLIENDTSYIYWLPFAHKKRVFFVQGANSKFSHKNEVSFDFKIKKHTKICAARAGVVVGTKSDSDRGGVGDQYLNDGNYIIIKHDDGSEAQYWHLELDGVLVKIGDTILQGQHIGYSGNTGYSAFPHLHFQVFNAAGQNILPRFKTKKKVCYIRPARWYRAVHR